MSAVGAQRVKLEYSSYGLGVVTVTAPGGDKAQPSGVSSRALLASVRPEAGREELAMLLRQQAEPLPCPLRSNDRNDSDVLCAGDTENGFYGHGLVDVLMAVTTRHDHGPEQESVPDGTDR